MYTIRRATLDDLAVIVDWNMRLANETENIRLDRATLTCGVHTALTDESKALYFVAEADGRVVGMLMITYEWSDWRNGQIWWIQSVRFAHQRLRLMVHFVHRRLRLTVYVPPEWRRRGVFRALYKHVHHLAQTRNVKGLRLYVEHTNTVAQTTYEQVGIKRSHYMIFECMPL